MANIYTDYNGTSKSITGAVAQTLTFTGSDVPGAGVVAYHFYMTGAGNSLAVVTRIRIKANSQTIFDFSVGAYRAWLERISRANTPPIAAATHWTIPLYLPDAKGDDRYVSQFPANAIPTIEVVVSSSAVAGTILCGWQRCDLQPTLFPKFLGYVLNLPASVTNFQVPISNDGEVRGYSFPTTGLNRVKLVLDDVVRHQVDGTFVLEDQFLEGAGLTITDPVFKKLHGTQPAPPGRSYWNADSGAAWVGTANEAFLWSFHAQGGKKAAA